MSYENMIEMVARAIAKELGSTEWSLYVSAARAATRALREPTPDMLQAAAPDVPDWDYLCEDWVEMIDFVAEQPISPVHEDRALTERKLPP